MPPKTWLLLSDGIGRYRNALAHALGKQRDTVDAWCRPQPAPTPEDCDATGRRNPLDLLDLVLANSEHPNLIREALLDRWGYLPIRRGRHLIASAAILLDEAEQLGREDRRRKPRLTPAQIRRIRDNIIEQAHRLAEQLLKRLGEPK